jgi:succinate dehydrogenase / fumarate reductase iron-sulfur subunit
MKWQVTFQVFRYKQDGSAPHFDSFQLEVKPDDYVVDAVERIWAFHDRSLVFRHSCHHAGCGACGMLVNGREKLVCKTRIDQVASNGSTVKLEPMRNFPVISDLAVDMGAFYAKIEETGAAPVTQGKPIVDVKTGKPGTAPQPITIFANCIECGLCVSACPTSGTDPQSLGPVTLAAAFRRAVEEADFTSAEAKKTLMQMVDSEQGVWRCHAAFECVEACPSSVDPAAAIMELRRRVLAGKLGLLGRS